MIFRLFVSPRGFTNVGTIYEFGTRAVRDAAHRHLVEHWPPNESNAFCCKITADEARYKLKDNVATKSYVTASTASEFNARYGDDVRKGLYVNEPV